MSSSRFRKCEKEHNKASILHYCTLIPCVVSEKIGTQRLVHDTVRILYVPELAKMHALWRSDNEQ